MENTTASSESLTAKPKRRGSAAKTLITLVVIILVVALLLSFGPYKPALLPFAYWGLDKHALIVGEAPAPKPAPGAPPQHGNHQLLVGGTVYDCGFFSLTKRSPTRIYDARTDNS